ncbi:PadR family transcriptional regulator [Tepidibacter hydrothermalis]|uniref:PadR family transcriptional regulator n=1 Tax=Tepidibacter hydrothermalis TaxID=3036126 RepID=A0ABY8EIU3_9FIRM|nr:PadR family transcriptional regulator [Tepidibacter hydrothermalis]WFD11935.1 PadR family transcriptional regulator [Tepidibacter hydrothermalis]
MEYVILGMLMIKPLTIYEMNSAFKSSISLFYSASYGSIQSAVKKLVKNNLVEFEEKVEKGRNKKVYYVLKEGKEAFFKWMFEEIPLNKLEVTALSKLHFLGLVIQDEGKKQILKNIISQIELGEKELLNLNKELEQIEVDQAYSEILKYQLKTVDYGIGSHSFSKQWFKEILEELEK